jgi:hypothetical protein
MDGDPARDLTTLGLAKYCKTTRVRTPVRTRTAILQTTVVGVWRLVVAWRLVQKTKKTKKNKKTKKLAGKLQNEAVERSSLYVSAAPK